MSITIKDVAKEAGVSVATVSRVLNGSCNVSDESTKKVNETIARLNYSPNFLGRNLRKCETNVILVIMPTSEHSLYSKIVMGMQDYAGQVGYDIITAVSYSTSTAETRQMNMLFNRTVDGVILLGTQYDADSLNKLAENYNVALCCEDPEAPPPSVCWIPAPHGSYNPSANCSRLKYSCSSISWKMLLAFWKRA